MPPFACPLGHHVVPFFSILRRHARDGRYGDVPGSEKEWWAHVDDNEAHILPEGVEYDDLLTEED
jgi:hypothetical protein